MPVNALLTLTLFVASYVSVDSLQLVVIHTNDMHSRLEPISGGGTVCTPTSKRCFGGFARVKAYADSIRKHNKNVLFLNAGDTFQGTPYYSVYKWRVIVPFIDSLGIDVMSLGNHEFDDGVDGLAPYLERVKTPSVCANLDTSKEPDLDRVNLSPWKFFKIENTTIAVIGYLTPDTKFLSRVDKVDILDEITSLKRATQEVKDQGANLVFAVGHSGFDVDCKIAEQVEGLDLVVGGHTDTFLYTGVAPEKEVPASTYPHMVTQRSGKKVPVVQAYGYTKYVGFLNLQFDENYKLLSAIGNPVLMDSSVPQDDQVLKMTEFWKGNLTEKLKDEVGETYVDLSGDGCRRFECNMGNLVADSFRHYAASIWKSREEGWTDTPVAFINGGTVRASILRNETNGIMTRGDILTVMPFNNELIKITVNASTLKDMLEKGVEKYDPTGVIMRGSFPQVSGVEVLYDITRPPNQRVVQFRVQCAKCMVPKFYEPQPDDQITIITNAFLAGGGDGYKMLEDHPNREYLAEVTDFTVFEDYIKKKSPITTGIENRIRFVDDPTLAVASSSTLLPNYVATFFLGLYYLIRL